MEIKHFEPRFAALDKAFPRLSLQERAVFLLVFRDGCTIGEIAGRLGIERSMAEKYLAKAILRWRREIANRGLESLMNLQIEREAAVWLVEMQTSESSSGTRGRLNWWPGPRPLYSTPRWLRASRAHVRACAELKPLWEVARRYDSGRMIDVESLIAAARTEASVVPIEKPRSAEPECAGSAVKEYRVPANRRRLQRAAAAALALVIIAGLLGGSFYPSRAQEYATGIGEQRTLTLFDGSSVKMHGATRIRVLFSAHERRIDLLQGEALFSVVKDAGRPFEVVVSDGTRIRDIGTRFDVNRIHSATIVTVLEGRVVVTRPCSPIATPSCALAILHPVEVGAGQQVIVTPDMTTRPQPANLAAATAWTRNLLVFDSTPLEQAAEEFNRVNVRQLVIKGTRLQNLHVYGLFKASDPSSVPRFLQALRARQPGIQVAETVDRIIVTKRMVKGAGAVHRHAKPRKALLHRPAVADDE